MSFVSFGAALARRLEREARARGRLGGVVGEVAAGRKRRERLHSLSAPTRQLPLRTCGERLDGRRSLSPDRRSAFCVSSLQKDAFSLEEATSFCSAATQASINNE